MDASLKQSHHHYHHHCHFTCHHGHRHFICHHSPAIPNPPSLTSSAPAFQNPEPEPAAFAITPSGLNSETFRPEEAQIGGCSGARMLQDQEHDEQIEEDDYDDDEPIFVLTDEWKEFFAKSEARRKLEKKQAKKK